jgi:hypothetical protein
VPFSNDSSPASMGVSPASIRRSVVLPEPFRPDSVKRSPRSTLKETFRSSGSPATSFPSPDAITTATRYPMWAECSRAAIADFNAGRYGVIVSSCTSEKSFAIRS